MTSAGFAFGVETVASLTAGVTGSRPSDVDVVIVASSIVEVFFGASFEPALGAVFRGAATRGVVVVTADPREVADFGAAGCAAADFAAVVFAAVVFAAAGFARAGFAGAGLAAAGVAAGPLASGFPTTFARVGTGLRATGGFRAAADVRAAGLRAGEASTVASVLLASVSGAA
ncbi:hypothetical protein [Salinibacterium sp.]|uniref:hypothetical protein n=1 Tax=Salinibacterium sp. TaxID=1915057 RepID=UPI00286A1E5C|nr:hypothetical protein [Salinibacterium sp.]